MSRKGVTKSLLPRLPAQAAAYIRGRIKPERNRASRKIANKSRKLVL